MQRFNVKPSLKARIICSCGIEMRASKRDSIEDLIERWNTRAERTCVPHVEPKTFTGDTEPSFYQAVCDCGWIVGEDGTPNLSEFEHVDPPIAEVAVRRSRGGGVMSNCGQEMTLDDAIAHLDDMITGAGLCEGCLHEHEKLRGWLAKLKNLTERHERLEQVAREMYELIERWETERDDDRERLDGPSPCRGMIATAIKRQLESFGVSVDD